MNYHNQKSIFLPQIHKKNINLKRIRPKIIIIKEKGYKHILQFYLVGCNASINGAKDKIRSSNSLRTQINTFLISQDFDQFAFELNCTIHIVNHTILITAHNEGNE